MQDTRTHTREQMHEGHWRTRMSMECKQHAQPLMSNSITDNDDLII